MWLYSIQNYLGWFSFFNRNNKIYYSLHAKLFIKVFVSSYNWNIHRIPNAGDYSINDTLWFNCEMTGYISNFDVPVTWTLNVHRLEIELFTKDLDGYLVCVTSTFLLCSMCTLSLEILKNKCAKYYFNAKGFSHIKQYTVILQYCGKIQEWIFFIYRLGFKTCLSSLVLGC